jgi:predicted ribonuclease YlaK
MFLKEKGVLNVVIVSKDTSVRIKAGAMNVPAQDYKMDKTIPFQKYGSILKEEDYNNGIISVRYQCQDDEIYRLWSNDPKNIPSEIIVI